MNLIFCNNCKHSCRGCWTKVNCRDYIW